MHTTGHSEIARIRQQIAAEQHAAYLGLHGFAEGTSRHDFIEKKAENIGHCFAQLADLVGTQQAIEMVVETLQEVSTASLPEKSQSLKEEEPSSCGNAEIPTILIRHPETGGPHAFQ